MSDWSLLKDRNVDHPSTKHPGLVVIACALTFCGLIAFLVWWHL